MTFSYLLWQYKVIASCGLALELNLLVMFLSLQSVGQLLSRWFTITYSFVSFYACHEQVYITSCGFCVCSSLQMRRRILGLVGNEPSAATVLGANFSAGFVAGSLAAAATCPLDVAKTRRQIEVILENKPHPDLFLLHSHCTNRNSARFTPFHRAP